VIDDVASDYPLPGLVKDRKENKRVYRRSSIIANFYWRR
jgi:hypothetical protein